MGSVGSEKSYKTTKSATYVTGEDGPDKANPTFGEVVTIPADLATGATFQEGDVIQAQVKGVGSFGEYNIGIVTIKLTVEDQDVDLQDEGQMDSSCVPEAWAKLRDVYDVNLEETGTYTSPFMTWDIITGSENAAPKAMSIMDQLVSTALQTRTGSVGKLKGFFRIIYKPVYCQEMMLPQADGTSKARRRCPEIANYLFSDCFLNCDNYRCVNHKPDFEMGLDAFRSKYNQAGLDKTDPGFEDSFILEGKSAVVNIEGEKWNFRGSNETPMTYIENVAREGSPLTIELKKLINPVDVIVRCYAIRASDLSPADPDGSADAWLRSANGSQAPVGEFEEHIPDR